jgi:hypothetical protein
MKSSIIILLSVLVCAGVKPAFAQTTAGSVTGTVSNQEGKAMEGATVSLLKAKDSSVIKVSITGTDGKFEFEQVKDTCLVAVTFIGFTGYTSAPVVITAGNTSVQLPPIMLQQQSTVLIPGVTVVATKPFVERKIDRVIVNPDALITNAGSNALEILEKSPGVQVSLDGAISLKGKQGVVVLIDDRPTNLSGAALAGYLKSIAGSTMNTVEIMTTPPAKYDAAGNAGVINIRLKKTTVRGWSGSLNLSYGQGFYARNTNSLNFNYRVNKLNFFGNLAYNINNDYQQLDIEREYLNTDGSFRSLFRQGSFIKNERRTGSVRLGVDYYISKKITMGLVLNGFNNPSDVTTTSNADMFNAGMTVDSFIRARSEQHQEWKNRSVNLNLSHVFDGKGRSLTVNADRVSYRQTADQSLITSAFLPDNSLKSRNLLIGNLPTDIDITTAKVDYVNPIKGGGNLEGGVKVSYINTDNTADFFDEDINGNKVVNYNLSNRFKYDENINAAYVNFNRDFNRLSLQAGLRLEHTKIQGDQLGNPQKPDSSFERSYTNLFPTFYLSYKLDSNANHQLGLSYGRRIQRPNYQDLNPFVYPLDKFTFFAGNPYLRPTFSHNIELSHTFKNTITTTLQYSSIKDVIQETIEQSSNLFVSRPGNIGKQTDIGVSVNVSWQPAKIKWWTQQLYTEVVNNHFEGMLYTEKLDARGTYWLLTGTSQFKLSKLWSAEIGGFVKSSAITGQFSASPIWIMRIGGQKRIMKERGSIRLVLNDVFKSFEPRGRIVSIANSRASYHNYLDSRVLTLSFSYRFSKGSGLRARQSGGSDSERNRISTNQ